MIKERRRTTGVSRERDDSRKEEKADIWWNEWPQRKILSLSLSSFVSNETTLLIYSVQCSRTKLKMTRSSIFCISFKRISPFMYSHIHRLNFKGHQMARYNRCEIPHPSPPLCSLFSPRRWISGNCRNETRYECKWNERSNVHILSSAMLWNLACIFTSLSLCARLFNQIKIDRLERRLAIKIR